MSSIQTLVTDFIMRGEVRFAKSVMFGCLHPNITRPHHIKINTIRKGYYKKRAGINTFGSYEK